MTTAKRVHLWEDGTWDEQGGHWVAVRQEEYEEMLDVIASASSLERRLRLSRTITAEVVDLLNQRLKAYRTGLRQAVAHKADGPA